MTIYEKIKKYSAEKHLSVRQVEIAAGLSNGVIGKWRRAMPSVNTLDRVAAVLGVSISDLMPCKDELNEY